MPLLTRLSFLPLPLLFSLFAHAQVTDTTCSSSYGWAANSLGQSPCMVAAYLFGACKDGNFSSSDFDLLNGATLYAAPTVDEATMCACSTVTYSLVSACLDCQNNIFLSWPAWSINCKTTTINRFPVRIPEGTEIPPWATLDVVASGNYNRALAERKANELNATATTNGQGDNSVMHTPAAASPNASSTTNVAAIAGGVVGGVLFLALVVSFVVWYILKRRRQAYMAPSAQFRASEFVKGFDSYEGLPSPIPMVDEKDHHVGRMSPSTLPAVSPLRYNSQPTAGTLNS